MTNITLQNTHVYAQIHDNVCERFSRNRSQIDSYFFNNSASVCVMCISPFLFANEHTVRFVLSMVLWVKDLGNWHFRMTKRLSQNESVKIVYELFTKPFFAHRKRKQLLLSCYYRYGNITFLIYCDDKMLEISKWFIRFCERYQHLCAFHVAKWNEYSESCIIRENLRFSEKSSNFFQNLIENRQLI